MVFQWIYIEFMLFFMFFQLFVIFWKNRAILELARYSGLDIPAFGQSELSTQMHDLHHLFQNLCFCIRSKNYIFDSFLQFVNT